MLQLALLIASIYKCYSIDDSTTSTDYLDSWDTSSWSFGWGSSGWYDYFGWGWDWDWSYEWNDTSSGICWPTNVCLKSYYPASDTLTSADYYYWGYFEDFEGTVSEETSREYVCMDGIAKDYYYNDGGCSGDGGDDTKYETFLNSNGYVSCENTCDSYVKIREYYVGWSWGGYNWTFDYDWGSLSNITWDWENYNRTVNSSTVSGGSNSGGSSSGGSNSGGSNSGKWSSDWDWDTSWWNDFSVDCDNYISYHEHIEPTGCYPAIDGSGNTQRSKKVSCTSDSYTMAFYDSADCTGKASQTVTYSEGCNKVNSFYPYKIEILECPEYVAAQSSASNRIKVIMAFVISMIIVF